jgi:hypothetical protein
MNLIYARLELMPIKLEILFQDQILSQLYNLKPKTSYIIVTMMIHDVKYSLRT